MIEYCEECMYLVKFVLECVCFVDEIDVLIDALMMSATNQLQETKPQLIL